MSRAGIRQATRYQLPVISNYFIQNKIGTTQGSWGLFTRFGLDIADPRQPTRDRAAGPGTIAQGQEQNKATRCTVRADPIRVPCKNYGAPIFLFIEHEEARESNTLGRACLSLRRRNYASGEGELPDPAAWP